ncbi:MAG: response regulator [Rariglobus sp.]
MRILVVDDDELFRTMLRAMLEQLGHTVTEASDGRHALEVYQAAEFDLVLTDLIMPGKEGIETILALRKINREVKIIAMSGGGRVTSMDYLDIARQVGAKRLLKKPFTQRELQVTIQSLQIPEAPSVP